MPIAGLVLLGEVLVVMAMPSSMPSRSVHALTQAHAAVGTTEVRVAVLPHKGKGKRRAKGPNTGPPHGVAGPRRGHKGKVFSAIPVPALEAPAPEAASPPARKLGEPKPLPTTYTAVALVPLQAFEVPEETQQFIEQALFDEVDQLQGFRGVSASDLQADLTELGLNASECDRDVTCLAQAGRYGRAHLVLEPRLSALGGADAISLRLIDTVNARETERVAEPLAETPQAQALQLHRLVAQLLTPDAYEGNIAIMCDVEGAEVYLDDKLLGTTPLPSQDHLHAGVHILRVSKVGYSDINRFVDVVFNRASTIQVNLNTATVAGLIVEMRSTKGFGALFIVSQEPGWEIRIDGEPLGMTPLNAPMDKIPVGKRHITMKKAGSPPVAFDVDIKPEQRTSALLNITPKGPVYVAGPTEDASKPLPTAETILHPPPPPPPPPPPLVETHTFPTWRLWAAVGTGGAGVAVLGVSAYYANRVHTLNGEAATLFNTLNDPNTTLDLPHYMQDSNQLAKYNADGKTAERNEWITLGVGGALVATGAGFLVWDLFHTELRPATAGPAQPTADQTGTTPSDAAPAPPPAAPKTTLRLSPTFLPGGGGMVMDVNW